METGRRRALGMGLEQLFGSEVLTMDTLEEKIVTNTPKDEILNIKISEIRANPYQPRKHFDENALKELALSIKEHGVFQPIIVKKSIKGYELVAGERRVRASLLAGFETVPAIIREFDDVAMMEIALLENLQREDLNPIEEAVAYQRIIEAKGISQDELAKRIGKTRSYVTNMIGLVNLPDSVKQLVIERKIPATHARTLSKIDDEEKVLELADRVINEGLTTIALDEIVQGQGKNIKKRNQVEKSNTEERVAYRHFQEILGEKLNTRVRISTSNIKIDFENLDDFNRIIELLKLDE